MHLINQPVIIPEVSSTLLWKKKKKRLKNKGVSLRPGEKQSLIVASGL